MFKFELDQVVFYIEDNCLHSAPVLSRNYVDNIFGDGVGDSDTLRCFGPSRIQYSTIHGTYSGKALFATREELAASFLS